MALLEARALPMRWAELGSYFLRLQREVGQTLLPSHRILRLAAELGDERFTGIDAVIPQGHHYTVCRVR